jgi:hypothetical protein
MKKYAIIENNIVVNVIVAAKSFVPPDSTYVLSDNSVSVGDKYENGVFINPNMHTVPIVPLTLEEIDNILAMLENENNS